MANDGGLILERRQPKGLIEWQKGFVEVKAEYKGQNRIRIEMKLERRGKKGICGFEDQRRSGIRDGEDWYI